MLFLKLGNLRLASLFPRDPRSFPDAPSFSDASVMRDIKLPHVERVIGHDEPTVLSQDNMKLPRHAELVDLLAKYGNSTSTAWIDPGYKIWRHERTGAAIGYIDSHGKC